MEEKNKAYKKYQELALEEIENIKLLITKNRSRLAASRCYFSCFYAMKFQLDKRNIVSSSHKQTAVEFRKHFIKTGILDKKYSKMLTKLVKIREASDYDLLWTINNESIKDLFEITKDFVNKVLSVK